ncbi:Dolichyldiphosphatase 1 [Homalodisca vitripennis]|nr:Dolichyldiphosphatase 1 [Homalodisca vitripennis]
MNNNTTLENVWKAVITASCLTLAVIVTLARVYLQYHTWQQVLWGAVVGFLFGTIWFTLTYLVFTPLFPVIVSWYAILHFFVLRVCSVAFFAVHFSVLFLNKPGQFYVFHPW